MFLPINCNSLNDRAYLSGAILEGHCSYFKTIDETANIILFEYCNTGTNKLVACDLVIYMNSGKVYHHDYMLMEDNNWRDAFGTVSFNLDSLFPDVLLTAKLVNLEVIDSFLVE